MIGSRLAHYLITGHLGTGGMGEVYQATDSKLGRSVALKLLPEPFARDEERVARFEREARVLASLNYPNIAAIYGFEESAGRRFLVMELVRGETLAERIARGPIPLDEAITIALQIADALEAAHESGVVHRDLKPANVKITPEGNVKVLDFGLSKAYAVDASSASISNSPTLSMAATQAGVILGTAAYMAPEQAKARSVDRRADIWAFGCVLYEMLTGQRAFSGADVSETLAFIIAKEPDWTRLPQSLPPAIRKLLRRCLEKDARKRLASAADARLELEEARGGGLELISQPDARPSRTARYTKIVAAVLLLTTLGLLAALYLTRNRSTSDAFRASILLPPDVRIYQNHVALAPDGRNLAFVGVDNTGGRALWVRELNGIEARSLPGTEGAVTAFWSPDSRFIAFFGNSKLRKVAVAGGPVLTICDCIGEFGSWGAQDVILFVPRVFTPLMQAPAAGGMPTPATSLDAAKGETSHSSPFFLPDGRHFLYHVEGTGAPPATYVGELDSTNRTRLLEGDALAATVLFAQGYLLYVRDETLVAQPFDVDRLALQGEPSPLAEHIRTIRNFWYGRQPFVTVSQTGSLVVQTGRLISRLVWYDRSGKPVGEIGEKQEYTGDMELSPDGKRLAISMPDARRNHIWFVNGENGTLTQFTFGSGEELGIRWSPDGKRAVYRSIRQQQKGGIYGLYQKSSDGAGAEEIVLQGDRPLYPDGWRSDEKTFFYLVDDRERTWDLWQMSLPDRKSSPLVQAEGAQEYNRLSPDGRWIAYQSAETGRYEILITTFPKSLATWRVSNGGGMFPRWRRDGRELFYLGLDNTLMAASVDTGPAGVTVTAVRPLFKAQRAGSNYAYDISPDGQRFLVNTRDEESAYTPLTLSVNWPARLRN